jgi:hypothetical protein
VPIKKVVKDRIFFEYGQLWQDGMQVLADDLPVTTVTRLSPPNFLSAPRRLLNLRFCT